MSDAEGIRNLVGTGLVQLVGGLLTAVLGLAWMFWLNWHLTLVTILVLGLFAFRMPYDEVAGIVSGACGNAAILLARHSTRQSLC